MNWRTKGSPNYYVSPQVYKLHSPNERGAIGYIQQQKAFDLQKQAHTRNRVVKAGQAVRWTLANHPGQAVQCDCMYLQRYSKMWPYAFVVVDVFSSAYAVCPLRQLKAQSTKKAMEKILTSDPLFSKLHIGSVTTDKGLFLFHL
jgi:hypothetical protein